MAKIRVVIIFDDDKASEKDARQWAAMSVMATKNMTGINLKVESVDELP